jgi:hypothetical protein
MNCYDCLWRKDAIGSAHSTCCFPGTKTGMLDCFMKENLILSEVLNIQASSHGVNKGWFMFPVNFDPVWLRNCYGFTDKTNLKYHTSTFYNILEIYNRKIIELIDNNKNTESIEFVRDSFKLAIKHIEDIININEVKNEKC